MSRARAVLAAARTPVTSARVAVWAWTSARRLIRDLPGAGMDSIADVSQPPLAGARHRSAVWAALRLAGATCLVRSAVLQRWDAAHDRPRPLVIGVAREGDGAFVAHAWLEGDGDGARFVELHRRPPS